MTPTYTGVTVISVLGAMLGVLGLGFPKLPGGHTMRSLLIIGFLLVAACNDQSTPKTTEAPADDPGNQPSAGADPGNVKSAEDQADATPGNTGDFTGITPSGMGLLQGCTTEALESPGDQPSTDLAIEDLIEAVTGTYTFPIEWRSACEDDNRDAPHELCSEDSRDALEQELAGTRTTVQLVVEYADEPAVAFHQTESEPDCLPLLVLPVKVTLTSDDEAFAETFVTTVSTNCGYEYGIGIPTPVAEWEGRIGQAARHWPEPEASAGIDFRGDRVAFSAYIGSDSDWLLASDPEFSRSEVGSSDADAIRLVPCEQSDTNRPEGF